MKKLGLVVAVLLIATAPVWAATKSQVDITCTNTGRVVTVNYKVTPALPQEPNKVRAYALDIWVDSGAKIIDVNNYPLGYTTGKYWVYPGSIDINSTTGNIDANGSPVASPSFPGTLPGPPDSNGMTIEMGSLYYPTGDNSPNSPNYPNAAPWTGTLLKFKVDKDDCYVTIRENSIRGGVVMTNPSIDPNVNSPGVAGTPKYHVLVGGVDCFPSVGGTYPAQYADWVTMKKPACWCSKTSTPPGSGYQCDGDADGKTEGSVSKYRVSANDLNLVIANWKKKITDLTLDPCADIDHKYEGSVSKYRVSANDLNIVIANWKKKDSGLPGNCPRP
jgi:hypothetical protein